MPPLSSGSSRETASTLNGSAVTSATPASPTLREEKYGLLPTPIIERDLLYQNDFTELSENVG